MGSYTEIGRLPDDGLKRFLAECNICTLQVARNFDQKTFLNPVDSL